MEILEKALRMGYGNLNEYESKLLLSEYGIPVVEERVAETIEEAVKASQSIGFPVVLKLLSREVLHKTERGLIYLNLQDENQVQKAAEELLLKTENCKAQLLVQNMIEGFPEIIVGMRRYPSFGVGVMFGMGGIFAEVLKDVSLRLAPLDPFDAKEMISEIRGFPLLNGYRGSQPADLNLLAKILIAVGRIGIDHGHIREIDINPLIVENGKPIAVDALVILEKEER